MATSGSSNYATSTQEIITEALELLGVLGEGEAYTPAQYTSCVRTLNMMIKNWQAAGLNLFSVVVMILFLKKDQQQYTLSSTTTDNFTFNTTRATLTTAPASSGASTVVLEESSAVGFGPGVHIGIQLSDGLTMFWTTVVSVIGLAVNLTDPLPSNVNQGAIVYGYQTKANRPMRILEAYLRRNSPNLTATDIPMGMLSRSDYWSLSTKNTASQPLQLYFNPQVGLATIRIWPVASDETQSIIMQCQATLDDFDNATDEPDYPQEWFLPLAYGLAVMLAPKYGTPQQDYARIKQTADSLYLTASGWDAEQETSVYFKPDNWGIGLGRHGN
jgi:hypothetical protein